jgi:excisionase family DNA binding protein
VAAWALCVEQMIERLWDGRWPRGQLIPELDGLREDLGMTTPPINRALQELVKRQLLTRVQARYRAGPLKAPTPPSRRATRRSPSQPRSAAPVNGFLRSEQFITVAEFATMLRVAKMTVYRLIRSESEELDAIRVGSSFRIPVSSARKYLASIGLDPDRFAALSGEGSRDGEAEEGQA